MKTYQYKDRKEYLETQIARSQQKAWYCKVYFSDIIRYHKLLEMDQGTGGTRERSRPLWSPILCLGVRTGAEVDIFRSVFFAPLLRLRMVQRNAIARDTSSIGLKKIELARSLGFGSGRPNDGKVTGVELNPLAKREDVFIGSFDQLPEEWSGRFQVIYSNSFDHSQDPNRTVAEWKRVSAPGAYVIIAFSYSQTLSDHDPLGGLTLEKIKDLWQAPIVFSSETFNQNGYHEICFKINAS
jgi:hypothetical protein